MVDQEVIDIIEEIRERVRSGTDHQVVQPIPNLQNPPLRQPVMTKDFAGLAVLSRAWDRLPPVVSNRSGASARLELWVKSRFKRLLRWVTWEQVNFNAATHQTFRELVETLVTYEQHLLSLQAELAQQGSETTKQQSAVQAKLNEFRAQLDQQQHSLDQQRELLHLRLQQLEIELGARVSQIERHREAGLVKVAEELAIQIREGDERILDEQRVSFKQLSVEANETFASLQSVRRQLESRLEKLESNQA